MATKVGEAYYEVYPKINQAAVDIARNAIGKGLTNEFAKSQRTIRDENTRTTNSINRDTNKVSRERSRATQDAIRDEGVLSRIRSKFSDQLNKESNKNEGAFHRLATQFRTIGTLMRGFAVTSAVLGGFQLLRVTIGAIAALMPIVNAGLAAAPALLAGIGAEALILKISFRGVGTAVKNAFNPAKAKQYAAELKKLAPAARTFVQEIAKLKTLKLPNLQQAFFSAPGVQQTGKNLRPFVQKLAPGAAGVATANGNLLGGVGSALTGTQGIKAFSGVLKSLKDNLNAAAPGLHRFTIGILGLIQNVTALGSGQAGKKLGDFLGKVGDFAKNVDVASVFAKATDAAHTFGHVLSDIWVTLSGIISALNGAGAFQSFIGILDKITAFVQSGTGKIFLSQLSSALSSLSGLTSSLTGSALGLLAGAFAALYPAIKPFADIVSKIGKDLVPLGPVIGIIISGAITALTNALITVEPWIKKTVGWLVDHKEEVGKVADKILLFVAAWIALKKVMGVAGPIANLVKNLIALPAPILAAIAAIALLVIAVYFAYKHSQTFRNAVHDLWQHLKELGKQLKPLLPVLKQWGKLIGLIVLGFLIADVWLLGKAIQALTVTIAAVKRAFDNMKHWLLTGWNNVKTFFTKTLPSWILKFRDWVVYAYNSVISNTHKWWSAFVNFWTGTVKGFFTKTIPSWVLKFRDWVVYGYNSVINNTHKWWSTVVNFFTGTVKNFFIKTIPGWWLKFRDWVKFAYNSVLTATHTWWSNVSNFFTGTVKNFFVKTVPGWFTTFSNAVTTTIKSLAAGIPKIWDPIKTAIGKPVDFVVNTIFNKGIVPFWNNTVGHIPGITKINPVKNFKGFASGGPIKGWGGDREDKIPAWLSNNEYVINAKKVKHYGRKFFDHLNFGPITPQRPPEWTGDGSYIPRGGRKFADGGGVPGVDAHGVPNGVASRVNTTLAWLRSIAGRVPYVLGGNGPNSFDCSSLVGNAWARLTNNPINKRYFVTGGEANWLLSHGFQRGYDPSGFSVGLTSPPEHTVGILAGHRFEAAHTGTKMRFDDGAANAGGFAQKFKMTGVSGLAGGSGIVDSLVSKIFSLGKNGAGYFSKAYGYLKNALSGDHAKEDLPKNAATAVVHGAAGAIFAPVKGLIAAAKQAAQFVSSHVSGAINSAQVGSWLRAGMKAGGAPNGWYSELANILQHESGGNPNAINRTDSNARAGHPSQGLMQLIPSNFAAYHAQGTSNNILDPVANIAAAVNYIQAKYGTVFNTPWAKGTGTFYREGGLVPQLYDNGGVLKPGLTLALNNTGSNEHVGGLPDKIQIVLQVDEFSMLMDARIAKHENDIIQYIVTH